MNSSKQYNLPPQDEDNIDLRKWMGKLFANWYWFVLSVIILVGASYMYTRYVEPTHRVESTLLIKDDNQAIGAEALFNEFDFGSSGRFMDNEIQWLKSWFVARRTLDQLEFEVSYAASGRWSDRQLYENVPFIVTLGPGAENYAGIPIYINILTDSTYQIRIYEDFNINKVHKFIESIDPEGLNIRLSKNPNFDINRLPDFMQTGEYYFIINNLDELATFYQNKLEADWIDQKSSVIKLSLTGFSAKKSADYLNALMNEYKNMGLEEKNRTASNTVDFIDAQLAGMADSVRIAGESLADFRSQNQVINLTAEGQAFYTKMETLNNERLLAKLRVDSYETRLASISDSDDIINLINSPSFMGFEDPGLKELMIKLQEIYLERESIKLSAKNADFYSLEKINTEIDNLLDLIREKITSNLKESKKILSDVIERENLLKAEMRQLPEKERRLLNMQSSFEMKNEMFTFLAQRRAEAAIAEASNIPDQKIIDEARVGAAEMVTPKSTMNYAIGVLLGLLIPFIIIVLQDFINTSVREKEDVENATDVPIIGSVGHNRRDEFLPAVKNPRSSIAESFRSIRTDLQFLLYKKNRKVIMVTSTMAKEGKSFISMNLAGIFSVTGKKSVVVGLDMRLPTIHKYMELDNSIGVSTFLIGKNTLEEIIIPSGFDNLSYIPAGPVAPNPAELLETPEFANLIEELKNRFDFVILDTPPVALVTDASLVARYSDVNLYIVRQNYTNRNALQFIDKFAAKEHVKSLNIIINDVVVPKYYGYKYGYGYGYGYGKGYGSGYYIE